MEVKFSKGCNEWLMFMDFWSICQKYWKPEKNEQYWEDLLESANNFAEKYESIPLAKEIIMAFINTQDKKYKAENK